MITASIINGKEAPQKLRDAAQMVDTALDRTVLTLAIKMTNLVKTKLGGDVLKVRSGRLRRSIHYNIQNGGGKVEATVGTNVVYGKVHELGGVWQIPAFMRMQRKVFGKDMKFPHMVNVRAHSATYQKRSFLVASLDQMSDEIREKITSAVRTELQKAVK